MRVVDEILGEFARLKPAFGDSRDVMSVASEVPVDQIDSLVERREIGRPLLVAETRLITSAPR